MPHLEQYPHHRGPLDVVGLGEGRPPNTETDVPDNGWDPAVTMVPVRGGRAAPPVKTVTSVDPAVDTSTPVWATAAIGARPPCAPPPGVPPARLRPSGLPPPRPWGCTTAHCAACSHATSLASLSSSSVPPSAETELLMLLPHRGRRTRCIHRRRYFYFCPCCCQFHPCRRCRRRYSLCRRSLAFLCRGNLGLLPVLCARGDRALRLSFGHAALVGGCCVGNRIHQTSCSSV
jgi:hypothetical protein